MRIALVVALVGCYHPNPAPGAPCTDNTGCPSGQSCQGGFCRLGDAGTDSCAATSCIADQLVDCAGAHTCMYGCAASDPPHCAGLAPSNGISETLLAGATADVAGDGYDFDTESGRIDVNGTMVRKPVTGVDAGIGFTVIDRMGVFSAHSFTVAANAGWTGGGSNALVLFAADTIAVHGQIDVGADHQYGGPGGADGDTGGGAVNACDGGNGRYKSALSASAGGGGGGGFTAGGAGAATMADGMGATAGGAGGAMCMAPSTIPLRGGNSGGAAGSEGGTVMGGNGGGAGGAIGLVAMTSVTIDGTVTTPGDGGSTFAMANGGGGGGGGGAVFVESLAIVVAGAVTANGGAGGAPGNTGIGPMYGERGHDIDALPAAGASYNGKAGGDGGAAFKAPTAGQTLVGGGGGGGAVGTVELRGRTTSTQGAVTSPLARKTQAALH